MEHIKAKINKWIKLGNHRKRKKFGRERIWKWSTFCLEQNELTLLSECSSENIGNSVENIGAIELVQL